MHGFKTGKKPQRLADGGKVKGPGTGTSDSIAAEVPEGSYIMPKDSTEEIGEENLAGLGFSPAKVPVNLSNGEYQLPPEQVYAIGVQALDQMKDATHTQVNAQPAGFKPQLFFADGGVVDPLDKRFQPSPANPNFQTGQSPEASAYQGSRAAGMGPAAPATAKPSAVSTTIDGAKQGMAEAKGAWNNASTVGKAKMATGAVAKGLGRAAGAYQVGNAAASGGDDLGALYASDTGVANKIAGTAEVAGNVAANVVTNLAKRAPIVGPMIGSAIGDRPATQLSRMVNGESALDRARADVGADPIAPRGALGFTSANAAGVSTQGKPTANQKVDTVANPMQVGGTVAGQSPAGPQLNDPNALNGVTGSAVKDAPGIVKLQGGMFGKAPMYTDSPIRAANEFNQVQIAPSAAGFQAGAGVATAAPASNGIGAPGGSSIGGASSAALAAARAAAAERGDFDAVRNSYQVGGGTFNGETTLDTNIKQTQQALMGAPSAKKRAALTQQLAALQSQQANGIDAKAKEAATQLARAKHDLESTAQGFQTRSAQRMENLQAKYDAAKTPEERASIAEQIRVLSGKAGDEWQSVALQGSTDRDGNKTEGVLAAVNKRTGEMKKFDGNTSKQSVQTAHADARAAMAKGLSKEEVNKRLAAAGLPTI